jgi:hypothetical protein
MPAFTQSIMPTDWSVYKGIFYPNLKADINASSNGANTIVAASAGMIVIALQPVIVCSGAVTVTWESSGGTIIGGPMSYAANGGYAPPLNPHGHFQTLVNEGLVLFLSAGTQVGGHLDYIQVVP